MADTTETKPKTAKTQTPVEPDRPNLVETPTDNRALLDQLSAERRAAAQE